jgi:uncharacterized membrane protein YozB (DUF420 family)
VNVHDLPAINAMLNGTCAILLFIARNRIKHKQVAQHRALMIAAFTTSIVFLISYLVYHAQVGSVHFTGTGGVRTFYFILLGTHTILAAAVPILATMTLIRGLKARYQKHVKIARWTYPVWMYVSATGVLVYLMLYQFYPSHI